jgi:hypothetical protein
MFHPTPTWLPPQNTLLSKFMFLDLSPLTIHPGPSWTTEFLTECDFSIAPSNLIAALLVSF